MTTIERWRVENGYSLQDLAQLLGCSRQYVRKMCQEGGTRGAAKIAKLMALAEGRLTILDFVQEDDKQDLRENGYLTDVDRHVTDRRVAETLVDAAEDELLV